MMPNSTGVIAGVVIGVVAFLAINLGLIYFVCYKRRKSSPKPSTKPLPEVRSISGDRRSTDELLQQLKEQEFECHDIEICEDSNGCEIELGSGGFGRVIKGVRDGVQPVAIKMMFRTDQKAQEDFLQEIKLLKQLSRDANIVQYFGASFQEDQIWLVTEFMEGGDLRKALSADDENRLTWWNGGKQIALDTARGLAFLHSRHVIHRDIKSHNILLTREGRAKIADVGMAQILSEDYYANSQQGTFAWASPELILREGRCTEKVDIYSFGVCLWEIATSQMPKRSQMFCPSPEECPPEVTRLIQDCMRRNPRDRPSAREIYRRLRVCKPISEDGSQLILDSAEAGGRSGRADKPHHGASYRLEPAPELSPIYLTSIYDSPMSTHEDLAYTSRAKHEIEMSCPESPLPASNEAFTQLVAKYSQAGTSTQALTTNPEDILATSSMDADLSHIPSVHDSMTRERMGLPDFVLNTHDSRYLDFTQTTQSSEDIYNTRPGSLTTLSLTMPHLFNQTHSADELYSTTLAFATQEELARSESEDTEDNNTSAVGYASVQGFAGSSQTNSRHDTESHNSESSLSLMAGLLMPGLERQSKEYERAEPSNSSTDETECSDTLEMLPFPTRFEIGSAGACPVAASHSSAASVTLQTGASSIHTGSTTIWEEADEQPPWLKHEEIQAPEVGGAAFKIRVNTC